MNRERPYQTEDSRSRLEKGFDYEKSVWNLLEGYKIEYEGNPKDFCSWKRVVGKPYDLRVFTVRKGWLKIECKFTTKRIYHSWFIRDWLSRDANIIVTNNIWNVPYADRGLLKEKGIKLMDTYQFLSYVIRLCKRRVTSLYLNEDKLRYIEFTLDEYFAVKTKPNPDADSPEEAYSSGLSNQWVEESLNKKEGLSITETMLMLMLGFRILD